MANPWFRMHAEFEDDPKVRVLSEPMQIRLVWLFCEHCKGVTLSERHRTFQWRCSEQELASTKAEFISSGFMDEDWKLLNWNKRQYISDSSTERTKRYRERKRTSQERHSDDVVTAPDTDTDTDTEQKKPARDKRESDPRFKDFKEVCRRYFEYHHHEMLWDGSEGKQLSSLLKADPNLTAEHFRVLLGNRTKSDAVNHSERPSLWLRSVTKYTAGPLDKFNKLLHAPRPVAVPATPGNYSALDEVREMKRIAIEEKERQEAELANNAS